MKTSIWLFILTSVFGALAANAAQSASSARASLVGTWRFVSATQQLMDGTVRPDPQTGTRGVGYLIYTETGQVCAMIASPDRPKWTSATPTDAQIRDAFNGMVAYCGTFEVNAAEGYVIHHVEMDREPNMVGAQRKRFFSFSGNHLILRPAPPLPPGVREWTVEWERVEK